MPIAMMIRRGARCLPEIAVAESRRVCSRRSMERADIGDAVAGIPDSETEVSRRCVFRAGLRVSASGACPSITCYLEPGLRPVSASLAEVGACSPQPSRRFGALRAPRHRPRSGSGHAIRTLLRRGPAARAAGLIDPTLADSCGAIAF